ncbi:ABC transporter ATP-binding protein [Ancylobacter sp. IITR112]|uniref:ABC transporter ATP-binding protein n=1 Tax=Ancylobacter sp. IITR112 TaxID=3138073 RepID=UPI00352AE7C2
MSAIRIAITEKRYRAAGTGPGREIFRDFRLDVDAGAFVALLGESGIGKTTLLNIVAGLDRDFRGDIRFGADSPRLAYAFQNPRLLPWRTVLQNVALPLPSGEEGRDQARAMLDEVGLAELADAYPERLSLGQQRRVALARAFVIGPDVLLMDEPFVSLDEAGAARLRNLLRRLLVRRPATVLFVTHDRREAVELASRIVVLEGAPVRILRDMALELTAQERATPSRIDEVRQALENPTVG